MHQQSDHSRKKSADVKHVDKLYTHADKKVVLSIDLSQKKRSSSVKKEIKSDRNASGDYQPDSDHKKYKSIKTDNKRYVSSARKPPTTSLRLEKEHSGVRQRTSRTSAHVAKEESTSHRLAKHKGDLVVLKDDCNKHEKLKKTQSSRNSDCVTSGKQMHHATLKIDSKCATTNFAIDSEGHANISMTEKQKVQQAEPKPKDSGIIFEQNVQQENQQELEFNRTVQKTGLSQQSQPEILDEYADDNYASDFDDVSVGEDKVDKLAACTPAPSTGISQPPHEQFEKPRQPSRGTSSTVYSSNISELHKAASTASGLSLQSNIIDFTLPLRDKRHAVRKRVGSRSADLLRLIDLDLDGCSYLFELRPLDEYANYMLRFGKIGHSQRQVQTQEDAIAREVQTEPIYMSSGGLWTQIPPLDNGECCGKSDSRNLNDTKASTTKWASLITEMISDFCFGTSTSDKLPRPSGSPSTSEGSKLIEIADEGIPNVLLPQLRTMLAVLEEDALPRLLAEIYDDIHESKTSFEGEVLQSSSSRPVDNCDHPSTTVALSMPSTFGDSGCVACVFAPCNSDRLLTLHRSSQVPPTGKLDQLLHKPPAGDFIYVWSICGGSGSPLHQLYSPGLLESSAGGDCIACATFSPDHDASFLRTAVESISKTLLVPTQVIGGLVDGSLCVWDLRCNDDEANNPPVEDQTHSVIQGNALAPSYCTVGMTYTSKATDVLPPVISTSEGLDRVYRHIAPITDLQLVMERSTMVTSDRSDSLQSGARNFHFAAIDYTGELTLWLALSQSGHKAQSVYDVGGGSHSDLGLRPGGRVRLIQLMHLSARVRNQFTTDGAGRTDKQLAGAMVTVLAATPKNTFLIGFTDGNLVQMPRSASQHVYPRQFDCSPNHASLFTVAVHPDRTIDLVLAVLNTFLVPDINTLCRYPCGLYCHQNDRFQHNRPSLLPGNTPNKGYADGTIRLFSTKSPIALDTLQVTHQTVCPTGMPLKLLWSYTIPFAFFCLHSTGCTTGWRLTPALRQEHIRQSSTCQLVKQCSQRSCYQSSSESITLEKSKIFDMALSQSLSVTLGGETKLVASLALIFSDSVKIHWLDPVWVQPALDEPEDMELFFSELLTFSPNQPDRSSSPHLFSVCS